jgi:hypothetical protein
MTKKTMSPHLRATLNREKDLEESGFYRARTNQNSTFYMWIAILLGAIFALLMYSHDRTKKEIPVLQKTHSPDYPITQRDIDFTKSVERSWKEIEGKQ